MRAFLTVVVFSAAVAAQLPEFNMLVTVDHGVVEQRPENGLYHYSTVTKQLTRLWPPAGSTAGWSEAVKAAQYSPDMSQIAFYKQQDKLGTVDIDGANPRLVDVGRPFKVSCSAFAWTEQGIFWYDKDTYELMRLIPATTEVSVVCTLEYLPNTTSFGGVFASRDGSRLWSWLTMDGVPENNPEGHQYKPFVYVNDNDYSNPIVRRAYKWGHGNMMLPDGSKSLHIGWEFSTDPITHPYIWIWNWDTFTQDSTIEHGVPIKAGRGNGLVQVANSSEWIGMMFEGSANYLWNWSQATAGAEPILMDLDREYYNLGHIWKGPYPDVQSEWYIVEPSVELSDASPAGTVSIANWSDVSDPSVAASETWAGTPSIAVSGSDVTITFSVDSPPAAKDTATVTITDGDQTQKTCLLIYTPQQTPAEQLVVETDVTDVDITLSWTNTIGSQFAFAVQEWGGSAWEALQPVTLTYADSDPVEGDNRYRVAAIDGADTSYQEVTAYYTAPASIVITSPSTGQTFEPGQEIVLRWETEKVPSVQVELSTDEGETYTLLTTSAINEDGQEWSNYPITLPAEALDGIVILVHPYQQVSPASQVSIATAASSVTRRASPLPLDEHTRVAVQRYDLRGRLLHARMVNPASSLTIGVTQPEKTLKLVTPRVER